MKSKSIPSTQNTGKVIGNNGPSQTEYGARRRTEQEKDRENTRIGISQVCFVKTVQIEGDVVDAAVDVARGHE